MRGLSQWLVCAGACLLELAAGHVRADPAPHDDLRDPKKSADRLVARRAFASVPPGYPVDWFHDGMTRMKARAVVQAAMARAGGAGHFDIPSL
jgi:hypothetical protein